MTDSYDEMSREELLYELKSAEKKIADYKKIFDKNTQLNECKKILNQYENFDELIYSISSRIIGGPVNLVDDEIIEALKLITEFTGTVRSSVYLFSDDLTKVYNAYEWSALDSEKMKDKLPEFSISEFSYFTECVKDNRIVVLENPDQLPERAEAEKKWYDKMGFRPSIMVPLLYDGAISGVLGVFGRKNETKNWNPQLAKQLHLLAEVIMSAINIKKNYENLKTAERNFKKFFERAYVGNVIMDLTGKIKSVNDTFTRMTGYSKEEIFELSNKDLIHPDDWKETSIFVKKIVDEEINEYTKETKLIKKDGKVIWVNFSVAAIKNSKEEITNLIGVVTDITERTKHRQAIEGIIKSSSSKNGKMFFETMVKELSYVLNASYTFVGEIKYPNSKIVSTLALCNKREIIDNIKFEVAGSPVEMIFKQGLCSIPCKAQTQYPDDAFTKESNINCYIAIPLYDRKEEIIGVMGAMFEENCPSTEFAEFILYLFASRTANELERMYNQKAMERLNHQLNEKNEELAQIIFVTSHDLRSPLVNAKGFSTELNNSVMDINNLLENESISDKCRNEIQIIYEEEITEYIGFINSSIDKMDSLLSGLLRLSRLGRAAVMFDIHNANDLINEVLLTFEFQIKEKNIKITVDDLPEVYGDKIQLNQVFSNIIDNAIKYYDPEKDPVIEIKGEKNYNYVVIEIKDNGIGIEKKEQARVFEIFHRIAPKDDAGLGLGMALVKKIMERHSGSIWLNSEWQIGTSFFIKLPYKIFE